MIEVKNITKYFGDMVVLNHESISINDREIVCLVGQDGTGKTTLLRLLAGILKADAGTIVMDDMPVYDNNNTKKHIFYIPSNPFFFMGATARDMGAFYAKAYSSFNEEYFNELLDMVGFDTRLKLGRCTEEQKSIFMLICAIASDVRYLIMDETLDCLNEDNRALVAKMFHRELISKCMTVILATNNIEDIDKMFNVDMEDTGYELRKFTLGQD